MNKEELLSVLDMSEDEQRHWLIYKHFWLGEATESLADLAFRLRDEAVERDWSTWQIACCRVWNTAYNPGKFGNRAKPIDWIIAALIAKGEQDAT